jgi:hypothetical protein
VVNTDSPVVLVSITAMVLASWAISGEKYLVFAAIIFVWPVAMSNNTNWL